MIYACKSNNRAGDLESRLATRLKIHYTTEKTSKEEKLFHERMTVQSTITYHYTLPCALALVTNSSLGPGLHPTVIESLLLSFLCFPHLLFLFVPSELRAQKQEKLKLRRNFLKLPFVTLAYMVSMSTWI